MDIHPVNEERWNDLVQLFSSNGNTNYCWCMTWRISGSKFRKLDSISRKELLQTTVCRGKPIGVLGYIDGNPIGWCSVAPRESYPRLERSKTIRRIDDKRTWSVVCFFLKRSFRRGKHSLALLKGAVAYAKDQSAEVVEGYPVEPAIDKNGNLNYDVSYRFMGYVSTYKKAGFKDVTPKDSSRVIMRYYINKHQQ